MTCPGHKFTRVKTAFRTRQILVLLAAALLSAPFFVRADAAAETIQAPALNPPEFPAWSAGFSLGAGISTYRLNYDRHLILANARVAKMLGKPEERVWGGKFEFGTELFSMTEYSPRTSYVIGLLPCFRYYFRPYDTWTPFLDVGAGVCATDMGEPDLSTTFEFNEQVGTGMMWNLQRDVALTLQYRFSHVSNAGIRTPNLGVNGHLLSLGMIWRF